MDCNDAVFKYDVLLRALEDVNRCARNPIVNYLIYALQASRFAAEFYGKTSFSIQVSFNEHFEDGKEDSQC